MKLLQKKTLIRTLFYFLKERAVKEVRCARFSFSRLPIESLSFLFLSSVFSGHQSLLLLVSVVSVEIGDFSFSLKNENRRRKQ